MQRCLSFASLLVSFSPLLWACQSPPTPPRPPVASPEQSPAAAVPVPADIRPYLRAARAGAWVYRRRDLREGSDRPEVQYPRETTAERMLEGDTTWSVYRTLHQRLSATAGRDQIERLPNPGGSPGAFALRFELADPMPLIPADLTETQPSTGTTRLDYLDLKRQPRGHGTLTRSAAIEGYEDVACPAGQFEKCLRVRIDLRLEIRWGLTIDWEMRVWLSAQAGEVRRVQKLSGWLLIFPFGSSFEHELVAYTPPTTWPADPDPPLWEEGLVAFDRGLPYPSMGALLTYFAETLSVEQYAGGRVAETPRSDGGSAVR